MEARPRSRGRGQQAAPHNAPRAGEELRGTLEVVLAMSFAGSSVVVGKLLSVRVPVFLSVELSLCAALAAILPLQIARRRELRLLDGRQLLSMLLQAVFGIALFRILTLQGLRFTSAASAGIITSAAPGIMTALAAATLGERPGRGQLLGLLLSVAGLFVINAWGGAAAGAKAPLLGNLLILGATVCEALLTIFRKASGGRIGSVTNTTVLVAMSALLLLPLALLDLRSFSLSAIDAVGWAAILYYGAIATVIAYILWGDGAVKIPAHRTGIAASAMPVSALILSAVVLAEPVGLAHLAGCAAVIAGIVVATL